MHFGLIVVALWVLLTALWYIWPTARADIYDLLLARTTEKWYATTALRVSGWPRLESSTSGCSLQYSGCGL